MFMVGLRLVLPFGLGLPWHAPDETISIPVVEKHVFHNFER